MKLLLIVFVFITRSHGALNPCIGTGSGVTCDGIIKVKANSNGVSITNLDSVIIANSDGVSIANSDGVIKANSDGVRTANFDSVIIGNSDGVSSGNSGSVRTANSDGINYDALNPCNSADGPGVTCDGYCRSTLFWCNSHNPQYCGDSEVRTNDQDLCADDDFWKQVSCNVTLMAK